MENGAEPFSLGREARTEIAAALRITVFPLLPTAARPAIERKKLDAIGKSPITAEDQLETLIGAYLCHAPGSDGSPVTRM